MCLVRVKIALSLTQLHVTIGSQIMEMLAKFKFR